MHFLTNHLTAKLTVIIVNANDNHPPFLVKRYVKTNDFDKLNHTTI